MPLPERDAATEERRAHLQARIAFLTEKVQAIEDEIASTHAQHEDLDRMRDHLHAVRSEKQGLVAEHVRIDLETLALHVPVTVEVVSGEQVDTMVFLSGFANHPWGRVLGWLNRHEGGPEALLGLVGSATMRADLPFPVLGTFSLGIEDQIRTLAVVANHHGPDRLIALVERSLRKSQRELEQAERAAARHARAGSTRGPSAPVVQSRGVLARLPRLIAQRERVLADLVALRDTRPTTPLA